MNDSADRFTYYEVSLIELRERLIRVLGTPTVNSLIDRSVIEITQAHPALASLHIDDDRLRFDGVRVAFADADDEQLRNSFVALHGVLLLLVARLLGREIAERLTGGLTIAGYLRGGGLIE